MAKTKGRKFIATATTAALVASAIVPVASAASASEFKDASSISGYALDAVNYAVSEGIINGYTDGTFKPQGTVTRAEAAVIVSKALGLELDATATTSFTDVKAGDWFAQYVAAASKAGIIKGKSTTSFDPNGKLTRAEAAVLLTVAYPDLTAGKEDLSSFSDAAKLASWKTDALKVAVNNGILAGSNGKLNADSNITRQDFASIVYRAFQAVGKVAPSVTSVVANTEAATFAVGAEATLPETVNVTVTYSNKTTKEVKDLAVKWDGKISTEKEGKGSVAGTVTVEGKEYKVAYEYTVTAQASIKSVTAVNAKTIEVTFDAAVDSSKATIELLRGTVKQNFTAKWAEDKKSVQLAAASNLQAADYTVNITGLSDKALTGTVKVEAQKVASIEILDDVAVVDKALDAGVFPTGTVATVGYVVKDQYGTDITKTTSLTTNSTLITTDSTKGVIKLTGALVEGKKVDDIAAVVLIDTTTGKSVNKVVKLSAASTVSSIAVSGIYNAKGEEVALNDKSTASSAFIVLDLKDQYGKEITDPAKATGLVITNTNPTNLTLGTSVTKQTIGNKDKLVIAISAILKAGNTDVLLISTTNGQSAKYTVAVAETSSTDAISVSQPEIAVAGEDTLIPLTVTDKAGNVITDKKLLSNATKGIKVDGVTVAESALVVKNGQLYYKTNFTTAGTQALVFQTANYKVATITLDVKAAAVPTVVRGLQNPLLLSTAKAPVEITAEDYLVIEDQYGRVIEDSTAPVTVTLVGTSDVVSVATNTVTALKKGAATLKIALVTPYGTVDSAVEVPVQVTDGTEFTGYEIATIAKTEAGKAKSFKVNGLLNNGKVALDPSEYTATISGGTLSASPVTAGSFTVATTALNKNAAGTKEIDTEFTLKVTINATGQVLEQKFVVSPDAPVTQDFFFTSSTTATAYYDAKAITEATLASGNTVADLLSTDETPAVVNVVTEDQYGNKAVTAISATTVTIVPEKVADVTIVGNGTAGATVTLKAGVEEATVTLKVTIGGATKEIKVKVVTP